TLDRPPEVDAVEHHVTTGIARLTVDWAAPGDAPAELVLLDADGTVAARVTGTALDARLTRATIDAGVLGASGPTGERTLTVAAAAPSDAPPRPLVAPRPTLAGAPTHGTARLGSTRVTARYDRSNRLQLRLTGS
ncbi:hypothetical protein, partial [Jatrophihabitans endophyticus]|uniref:hypothetical protein n=1 Tax=Jatrophihabitans endophyticus TaxID=1206085 RepID=UPI0019F753C2